MSKSKRIIINRSTGKSYMYNIELTIPAGRGRKKGNGRNARDEFVLSYMSDFFAAVDECMKDVGGESRVYCGGEKK